MTIDEFATIKQRIIKRDGFDEYLPTLCFPARRHIMVLEGVPEEKQPEIRHIGLKWAEEKAQADEEFLLTFKEDAEHFRVIRRFVGHDEEQAFRVEQTQQAVCRQRRDRASVENQPSQARRA